MYIVRGEYCEGLRVGFGMPESETCCPKNTNCCVLFSGAGEVGTDENRVFGVTVVKVE